MSEVRIRHHTVYRYREPVQFGRHRLVLRPREGHDLRVESMEVAFHPAGELLWTRDVHGNSIGLLDFHEPADRLEVTTQVHVQHLEGDGLVRPGLLEARWPIMYDPLEAAMIAPYVATSYPDDVAAVQRWLEDRPVSAGLAIEAWVSALNRSLQADFTYVRREEKGVYSPAQTIEGKRGSCRDLAVLLMEACRSRGIAARFASGYLECLPAAHGEASMHAWVEVYLPGYGWRGYDATSGRPAGRAHILTGVSHHPRGVMPVSGTYTGERADFLDLTVSVGMEWPDAARLARSTDLRS